MYKVSKPFTKVWFWVLAVILIIIIGSALNGGSDSNKASDNGGEK